MAQDPQAQAQDQMVSLTAQEIKEFAQFKLTREYLRRAILRLKKATEFFDPEISDVEEEEENITKFISEVKRRNLI